VINVVLHQLPTQLLELLTILLPLELPLFHQQLVETFIHTGTPNNASGLAQSCHPLARIPALTLQQI